jgi:hypothetical protein
VSYEMNGHDDCGTGFGTPTAVLEGPTSAPGACDCGSCSITDPGSCTKADFAAAIDGPGGACTLGATLKSAGGACTKLPADYKTSATSKAKVTPAPWQGPGACTQTQGTPGAVLLAGQGQMCALAATLGGGCAVGGVCAPTAASQYSVCIAQNGDKACPAGYPNKHTVGTGYADKRTCGSCSCSVSATCVNPTETIYTQDNCSTTGSGQVSTVLTADGQCDDVNDGNGQTYVAYTYAATVSPSCGTTGGSVSGTVTVTGGQTVCCP